MQLHTFHLTLMILVNVASLTAQIQTDVNSPGSFVEMLFLVISSALDSMWILGSLNK